jgi:hypothetical protein
VTVSPHSEKHTQRIDIKYKFFEKKKLKSQKVESKRKTSLVIVNNISCAAKNK